MFFLSPLNLWALLGLAVPIAIHLWSKKEGKTIKIGSIRLLQEADSKQSSSIKLNEWWLLFLRLLILSLLVLIIAEPRLEQSARKVPITYLIESSLLGYDEVNRIIDTLDKTNSIRLFEKGFPKLDREQGYELATETPNYWQLAKELQDLRSDSIVVFTSAFISGIKGKRPTTQENINWIFLDIGKSEKIALKAVSRRDELNLLNAVSNSEGLHFETEKVSINDPRIKTNPLGDSIYLQNSNTTQAIPLDKEKALVIELYYKESLAETEYYIEVAFKAISKYLDREIKIHKVQNKDSLQFEKADVIVWLSDEDKVESTLPMLIYQENKYTSSLIISGGKKNEYFLTSSLNSENSIERYLAENLLEFFGFNRELEKNIVKLDKRVMPAEQFLPNLEKTELPKERIMALDISNWFWLFLIPIIITERVLSRFRNN